MLQVFRQGIGSWFVKGFMGLLIFAFVIWGIADVFRNFGSTTLAHIGKTQISIEAFRRAFTERLQKVSKEAKIPITPAQAQAVGLDRELLGEMIAQNTLDENARNMYLGISNDVLTQRIMNDPVFKGNTGKFSHDYFLQVLRANGLSEAQYIEQLRQQILREHITAAFTSEQAIPKVLVEAMQRYDNEERTIEFVKLGKDQAGQIPPPTQEQLQTFYETYKTQFYAPEYRKIVLLALTPEALSSSIEVSDEDVRKEYEAHIERYRTPERREVDQIIFPNMEEASAAAARIAKGTSFDKIAEERKLTAKDISLGLVAKSDIVEKAAADAAFSLAVGKVSPPVAGRFTAVLLRVKRIEPGSEVPLSNVASALRQDLKLQRARRKVRDLRDTIEDERASGSTIAETAKKVGVNAITIEAVDRSGRKPDNIAIEDFPGRTEVLAGAFRARPGVETDPIEIQNQGGYVWYEVPTITPTRERSLEEARGLVETSWRRTELDKKLNALAETVRGKIDSGENFAKAIPGVTVERREGLKRRGQAPGLDPSMVPGLFEVAQGKGGIYVDQAGQTRLVYRVSAIAVPAFTLMPETMKGLTGGYRNDLLSQYVFKIENELGVTVNEAALRSAVGGDRN